VTLVTAKGITLKGFFGARLHKATGLSAANGDLVEAI
jgi:hypothetical protein